MAVAERVAEPPEDQKPILTFQRPEERRVRRIVVVDSAGNPGVSLWRLLDASLLLHLHDLLKLLI